jgi:hypothetical protein
MFSENMEFSISQFGCYIQGWLWMMETVESKVLGKGNDVLCTVLLQFPSV